MMGSFKQQHCPPPRSARARDHIEALPQSPLNQTRGGGGQLNCRYDFFNQNSASKHQLSVVTQMNSTCHSKNYNSNNNNNNFRNTNYRNSFLLGGALAHCHQMLLTKTLVAVSCLVLFLIICPPQPARTFFIDERQSPSMSDWNYADQFKWRSVHRDCAGRAQSPIDIQHKNVIVSQHLRLHFYNYNQQIKFKLSNAHHTIKLNPIGPPYDDEGDTQHRHGASGRLPAGSFNTSSIHDMITADEYVEFLGSNTNQQHQQPGPSSGGDTTNLPLAQSQSQSQVDKERLMESSPVASGDNHLHQQQHRVNLNNRPPLTSSSKQNSNYHNGRHNNNNNSNDANAMMDHNHPNYIEHEGGGDSDQAESATTQTSPDGLPYEGAPTIKLDWLDDGNNEYKLRDIHFHWGERRDNGSEHAIDGRRAAMEMHLVHIKQGLDKSKIGFTSDSVAVIAVLIESHRKSNADFNPIVNELARINSTEEARDIDYKSIYDLLPTNLDSFYTYSGSLTTPPCYQVVNWIVLAERLNMNAKQIEMFRSLYAPAHSDDDNDDDDRDGDNRDNDEQAQHGARGRQQHNQYKWRLRHGNSKPPIDPYSSKNQSFQSLSEPPSDAGDSHDDDNNGDAGGRGASSSHTNTMGPEMIMPNIRSIQELNNRTILASFNKYGTRLKAVLSASESVHGNGHQYQLSLLLVINVLSSLLLSSCIAPLLFRAN